MRALLLLWLTCLIAACGDAEVTSQTTCRTDAGGRLICTTIEPR